MSRGSKLFFPVVAVLGLSGFPPQARASGDGSETIHPFGSHLARLELTVEPGVFTEISPGIVQRPSAPYAAAHPDAPLFGRDPANFRPLNVAPFETQQFRKGLPVGQTLGQWLAASGQAVVECTSSGGAEVEMSFRGLKPNGVYTLWQVEPAADFGPLGGNGALNSFLADSEGEGEFQVLLGFCPGEVAATVTTALALHFDAKTNGDSPGGGLPGGTVFAVQMLADLNR